jgi:GST-like protein
MIDLYYTPTPNTWKVTIMLEECELPYRLRPLDLGKAENKESAFLAINPNGRVPAIVDRNAQGGPFAVFESGAILVYLAEKAGKLLPTETRRRSEALQWLFWQIGGLGPMAGQANYFRNRGRADEAYAVERYTSEAARLYGVMNGHLANHEFFASEYSIADIASWSWVFFHRMHGQRLDDFPHVARWYGAVGERPAVQRGKLIGADLAPPEFRSTFARPYWTPAADVACADPPRA